MSDTELEMLADNRIDRAGLPAAEKQHRFWPGRRFAFDRCWVDRRVALELEGGVYRRGWHQSIERYTSDCLKYSMAAVLGWRVIRCTRAQVEDGTMVDLLKLALGTHRDGEAALQPSTRVSDETRCPHPGCGGRIGVEPALGLLPARPYCLFCGREPPDPARPDVLEEARRLAVEPPRRRGRPRKA